MRKGLSSGKASRRDNRAAIVSCRVSSSVSTCPVTLARMVRPGHFGTLKSSRPDRKACRRAVPVRVWWLGEARRVHTISRVVSDRLRRFNNIESTVLSPPLPDPSGWSAGPYGDYLFYPSRLEILKRQSLVIEAMRHVETPVKLVLVGRGPDERLLRARIQRAGLQDRVRVEIGVPNDRLHELYRGALGVYFGPYDEDFGYVTIEGFAAARPVVTLADSGGPLEFVRDGETGLVAAPNARAIAAAFDRLWSDREAARTWGLAGNQLVRETVPEWPTVVSRLLG